MSHPENKMIPKVDTLAKGTERYLSGKREKLANRLGNWSLLIVYSLLIIMPLSIVVLASFKESSELYQNPLGLPKSFSFENYMQMFQEQDMGRYFMNSVWVTLFTVSFVLLFACMVSYAIMRIRGWLSWVLYGLFTVGMMVPAQVNMIPLYSLVSKLGLLNSLTGLIIVSTSVLLPIAVFILAGFMKTIPKELIEATAIDGANEWMIFSRVVLPVSLPSLSATAIFLFVMVWNDLLYPLLFITSDDYKTLPLALLQFQGEYVTNYPMIFAGVMIASAPMVIAYVFLQRYFIAGITAGSVKG